VLGSSLSALLFAYINDYAVVFTKPRTPFKFDYLSTKLDLSSLKIPFNNLTLKSFDSKMQVGIQKVLLWERILFLQSLRGNIISTKDAHSLRLAGNTITISNEYSKILDLVFEKCYYYGDDGAAGFTEKTDLDEATYICYDYIAFNSGGKHEIDYIRTGDDFVSEIWFYSSDRIDGNTPVRDACAVSTLTKQQLQDFDFSETMARFKTLQVMKDNGMRGKFNGYTKKGKARHYDFRTSSIRRSTQRDYHEPRAHSSCIEIKAPDEENLLKSLPNAAANTCRLLERLDENSS
jgi:hypothetical protein